MSNKKTKAEMRAITTMYTADIAELHPGFHVAVILYSPEGQVYVTNTPGSLMLMPGVFRQAADEMERQHG